MTARIISVAAVAFSLGGAALVLPSLGAAEEFRVENKVFVDDEKQPRIESTTIFFGNVVYDYLAKPAEVTIFDKAHKRFVLLDVTRRAKTEISTEAVEELTARLKRWAASQSDPFLRFLADPQFDIHYDESAGELVCSSTWMTYRVATVDAPDEQLCRQYTEFSDWSCQLNTMLNPGSRPPQARMLLNAALEARQRFPREVSLSLRPKEGLWPKRFLLRSEHQLIRQLVQSDRDRIAQTDQFMAIFTPVTFGEYQKRIAE